MYIYIYHIIAYKTWWDTAVLQASQLSGENTDFGYLRMTLQIHLVEFETKTCRNKMLSITQWLTTPASLNAARAMKDSARHLLQLFGRASSLQLAGASANFSPPGPLGFPFTCPGECSKITTWPTPSSCFNAPRAASKLSLKPRGQIFVVITKSLPTPFAIAARHTPATADWLQ